MRAVNLLPADARATNRPFAGTLPVRRTLQVGGALTVLLAALFIALFFVERSSVHKKQSELATDNARLVAVQAQVDAIRSTENEANARYNAVRTVVVSRMNWDRTMTDMARYLPTDVFLTNLSAQAPVTAAAAGAASVADAAPANAATNLTISGVAPSYVRIAFVLDRLALVPWLSNVTLTGASRASNGTTTFSIQASVAEVH